MTNRKYFLFLCTSKRNKIYLNTTSLVIIPMLTLMLMHFINHMKTTSRELKMYCDSYLKAKIYKEHIDKALTSSFFFTTETNNWLMQRMSDLGEEVNANSMIQDRSHILNMTGPEGTERERVWCSRLVCRSGPGPCQECIRRFEHTLRSGENI